MQKLTMLKLVTGISLISITAVYAAEKKDGEPQVVTLAMLEHALQHSPSNVRQWMDCYYALPLADKKAGQKIITQVYPAAFTPPQMMYPVQRR